MPKGRKISTWVVPEEKRKAAYEWIRKELKLITHKALSSAPYRGIRYTHNGESRNPRIRTVKSLQFKNFRVGLLHGRLTQGKRYAPKRFSITKLIYLSLPQLSK